MHYLGNKVFFYFLYRKEGLFVESMQGSAVNEFEAKVKQTFKNIMKLQTSDYTTHEGQFEVTLGL